MKKHRIVLVNPPVLSVLEPWYDTPNFVRTALACLAGYLRTNSNWEIKCLDAKFERKDFRQTVSEIVAYNPTVVGITAFTNEIKPAAYLAGLIKQQAPNIITVCGGVHITALPTQTLEEFPTFDIGVVGEGEVTLAELCNAIANGTHLNTIDGLVFRNVDFTITATPDRHRILDQNTLPMPAWDMLPRANEYYIQTIRGCPFACNFCMNHNGKVARKRSAALVINEMEWLIHSFQAQRISFGDELFSVDMNRTEELLDQMIEHKIGERVKWDIQTHVAFVNQALLNKMKKAGLNKIEMGVESGDMQTLKRTGKGTNEKMVIKAFQMAHRAGLTTGSFFIIGQPFETHRSVWQSLRLAIKINPNEPIFGTMVPYPGTEIARMAAKGEGGYRLLTTDWDRYSKQFNSSMEIVSMPLFTIQCYQVLAYLVVFVANFRWWDLLKFIGQYRIGVLHMLLRFLPGQSNAVRLKPIPTDYDTIIGTTQPTSIQNIITSREKWKALQSNEIKYAKEIMPELLKEQMPIK